MNRNILTLVVVAALGYFVDIYDLILFNVIKKESLSDLFPHLSPSQVTETGIKLFNIQMIGMLCGGVLWGIWGDKKGRISVLFGSIFLYSFANVANAFVSDLNTYAVIRFVAGIGLAGELGAGITLVAESMPTRKRGIGTMIIVTFGALGAVAAGLVGSYGAWLSGFLAEQFAVMLSSWQIAYLIGGLMGLLLLFLRIGALESEMYHSMKQIKTARSGDLRLLFASKKNALKYLSCILVGVPIWYAIGLLIANSEEIFAPAIGIQGRVVNGKALMFAYIGLSVGDFVSGLLSQFLESRKKVVLIYLALSLVLSVYYLFFSSNLSVSQFYWLCFGIGFATGYWAIFVTIASEQFGTNIRSTVANTVPNIVRGSVPLVMTIFGVLLGFLAALWSAFWVGLVIIVVAALAILYLDETFSKELDYLEEA